MSRDLERDLASWAEIPVREAVRVQRPLDGIMFDIPLNEP